MKLREMALDWLAHGRDTALVEVVYARGSVPRETGTRMLVSLEDEAGTIGGGHLEWKAIAHARALLSAPPGACIEQRVHYPLGPALGQCCGGAVTLSFERLTLQHVEAWPQENRLFHLQLYGAGHVGRAIVDLLEKLPVTVDWIDEREEEFNKHGNTLRTHQHVRHIVSDSLEHEVKHAPGGCFYLVLTHQHDLDFRITEAILRREDVGFLGLIGSRTKKQRFLHRLQERGVPSDALTRLVCPIGLESIQGKEPEVIAIAVVAQLLSLHHSKGETSPPEIDTRKL